MARLSSAAAVADCSDAMEMIKALQVNQTCTNPRNGGGTNRNANISYSWSQVLCVAAEHNSNT